MYNNGPLLSLSIYRAFFTFILEHLFGKNILVSIFWDNILKFMVDSHYNYRNILFELFLFDLYFMFIWSYYSVIYYKVTIIIHACFTHILLNINNNFRVFCVDKRVIVDSKWSVLLFKQNNHAVFLYVL